MIVFRKMSVLCFLETPVLRFALLPYYRRILSILDVCTWLGYTSGNFLTFNTHSLLNYQVVLLNESITMFDIYISNIQIRIMFQVFLILLKISSSCKIAKKIINLKNSTYDIQCSFILYSFCFPGWIITASIHLRFDKNIY